MRTPLITEWAIKPPEVNKTKKHNIIEIEAIATVPIGVYRRVIVICVEDSIVKDFRVYHTYINDRTMTVRVKHVKRADLKKIVDKALKVETYTDFRELLRLINHTKASRDPNTPKTESAECWKVYKDQSISSYTPPEIFGWDPDYLDLGPW